MKLIRLTILILFINSCTNIGSDKTYWCGDHACVNKAEKEAYFKKTMIVEFREIKKKDKKEQTKLNKIIEQAKKDEKKRISDERALKKQNKLKYKKENKEKKARLKKEKLFQKENIKKKDLKTENKSKSTIENKKINVVKSEPIDISEFSSDKFEDIVKRINDKNSSKSYPDINDTPN